MLKLRLVASAATLLAFAACGGGEYAEDQEDGETHVEEAAENTNPRFGVWQLESDRPAPANNIMTYEPFEEHGMKITIASTNGEGVTNTWGYNTQFDGEHLPVHGREGATSAVEVVDARTNKIYNATDGVVGQVIINVLSEDGNRIDNEYQSVDAEGNVTRTSHAVYNRVN